MQIVIHRGTHQIGGVATEIRTASARLLIDMGDELSLGDDYTPAPLSIPGVTDSNGSCDAVLFTHAHGDHIGQLRNIRDGIPLYLGGFAKDLLLATMPEEDKAMRARVEQARTFLPGQPFRIGDLTVTPFSVDHSACDSYFFLVEGEGKRVLHTGDFRLHGFRGKAVPKLLESRIGTVDALIIEGTALSRTDTQPMTEWELQQKAKAYLKQYKYVFVLCASTNLERICALSKAVPGGKYFICDGWQEKLLALMEQHWGTYSPLYRNIKRTVYGENLLPRFQEKGFLMMVRDNQCFREILRRFDPEQSIILYAMWDGYRTRPGSSIPDFLNLTAHWAPLHTSGHASKKDLQWVIGQLQPELVLPIHTDRPDLLQTICPKEKIVLVQDGEAVSL